jgi:hypothetical protein
MDSLRLAARASLRGVTSGIRSSGPPPIIGACWVFLNDKLDALLGALQFQALDITHVFLQDALLLPTVRSLVPAATTIVTDPRDLPPLPCQLALVGFRVHPGFLARLATAGVVAALALGGTGRFRRPWKRTRLEIRHSSLGGVTESCLDGHLLLRLDDWTAADLDRPTTAVPRDLSTLLSYGEPVLRSCPPPALQQVTPLCAHRTMLDPPTGRPVYHSGGLLSAQPALSTLIQAPHPFGWGIRCLSRSELLQVYDIGDRFSNLLPDSYDPSGGIPVSTIVEALKQTAPLIEFLRGGGIYNDTDSNTGSNTSSKHCPRGSKPLKCRKEAKEQQDAKRSSLEKERQIISESSI